MDISVSMVVTDLSIDIRELAMAVEERGFSGLRLADHTHTPVGRRTPYPLGETLPGKYLRMIDPIVGLAAAASVTTRIALGTAVLLVAQRDPVATAKALATIDHLAEGRLSVGVGFGWDAEEMIDHGVNPATRRNQAREHLLAMRALWEQDIAEYQGEFVAFSPSWSWPKPVQAPLPVLLGAAGSDSTFDAIVEYAEGWMPLGRRPLEKGVPELRRRFAEGGRLVSDLRIVCIAGRSVDRRWLDSVRDLGATEVCIDIAPAGRAAVLRDLDCLLEDVDGHLL